MRKSRSDFLNHVLAVPGAQVCGKAKEGKPGYVSLLQDGKHRFNGRAGVQDHQKTLLIRQLFNGERRELLGVISAGEC